VNHEVHEGIEDHEEGFCFFVIFDLFVAFVVRRATYDPPGSSSPDLWYKVASWELESS
jgi:hypothetical protein